MKRLLCYDKLIYFSVIVYAILISWISVSKHNSFETYAWDLGSYEQSLWSTLTHGKFFWNTPNFGHFHIHFEPVLFFILPIYAIYQSPITLLVLQSVFIGLSGIPMYWIAKKELNNQKMGFIFAVVYLFQPFVLSIQSFDFHTEAFMPFFLMLSIYYLKENRFSFHLLFLFLALTCKETVALVTVFLGVYLVFTSVNLKILSKPSVSIINKKRLIIGFIEIILSIAWFFFSLGVMSYFLQATPQFQYGFSYIHLIWWENFGKDPLSIIITIMTNPLLVFSTLIQSLNEKVLFILLLLIPFCFTSLMEIWILLIPVPWITFLLLSSNRYYWQLGLHYTAPIIPFIAISAVEGIRRLGTIENKINQVFVKRLIVLMAISTIVSSLYAVSLGIPHYSTSSLHEEALIKVINLIPPDASIVTQNNIFPHLSHRLKVYPGYREDIAFQYVLVDMTHWSFTINPDTSLYEAIGKVLPNLYTKNYELVTAIDGIVLLKKSYYDKFLIPFENGLLAKFFNNTNLSGKPAFETVVFTIDGRYLKYWNNSSPFFTIPVNKYSVVYEGFLKVPTSTFYTFTVLSSHGSRLFVNETLLINDWNVKSQNSSYSIYLSEGLYKIRVEQLKLEGEGYINLQWKTPDTSLATIPQSFFMIDSNSEVNYD